MTINEAPTSSGENSSSDLYITAILVTHNGATWLPEVIASLSSQTRRVDRIIAVDTGSGDSSPELLRRAGITFIEAEPDIGYGDAIELALDHAHPIDTNPATANPATMQSVHHHEWLWLIHDDCAPKHDALELLVEAITDRPQIVIAGPKLLGWYDRDHLLEAGISIAGNGARWTGLEHREQDQGQHDHVKDVLSVSTAAMLVSRNAFEELGGLDPNLALFRDDVDFGWRAHVAGFGAICVGTATAFHAEASATERRRVDVSEAFLHRPLLLDRRNAAYVMLVNSSLWLLPWVAIQILGTSIIRSIFDLLAKLPGYAADEIVAVGLLLVSPADVIRARRHRRKTRLLSPGIIRKFVPARGVQISAGFERLITVFTQKSRFTEVAETVQQEKQREEALMGDSGGDDPFQVTAQNYSDIGVISPDFDEPDFDPIKKPSIVKRLAKRPDLLICGLIVALSLIAGRHRFGTLSGGAMGSIPSSGFDLVRSYANSWHLIGMGSGVASPTWMPVIGLASLLTFGHLPTLITLLFFLTPPLSFLLFAWSLRKLDISQTFASLGGIIYVVTPVLWTSINQGRVDVLILYLLAPVLLFVNPLFLHIGQMSWRRLFASVLLVGVICSFSPFLFGLWLCFQIGASVVEVVRAIKNSQTRPDLQRAGWIDFLESGILTPLFRRTSLIISVFFLELPWSLGLLFHPGQFLVAPGIPIAGASSTTLGGAVKLVLNNPGGIGSPPAWIISPIVILIIISWLIPSLKKVSIAISIILFIVIVCHSFHVSGHGATETTWVGIGFVAICIILMPAVLKEAQKITSTIRGKHFGYLHIGFIGTSLFLALSSIMAVSWIVIGPSHTLVHSNEATVVPEFVSALNTTPARPKTLVLSTAGNFPTYFVSRGDPLSLGDADVATPLPDDLQAAIEQIETSAGINTGKTLGVYGIHYLFAKSPVPNSLARTIDGSGGFTRMSATGSGIVWRITGAYPRVMLSTPANKNYLIPSANIGATGAVQTGGVIFLAEKFDPHWKLLLNGNSVPLSRSDLGTLMFHLPRPGALSVLYDGTLHRALLSLQLLTLIFVVVMALPSGRRRKQVPLEELL